jgi:hypothetical protein
LAKFLVKLYVRDPARAIHVKVLECLFDLRLGCVCKADGPDEVAESRQSDESRLSGESRLSDESRQSDVSGTVRIPHPRKVEGTLPSAELEVFTLEVFP